MTDAAELIAQLKRSKANGDPNKYAAFITVAEAHEIARLWDAAESRATAAEGRVALLQEERDEARKWAAVLLAALTPSADTKAAYIGEFYMGVTLMARGQEDHRRVQIPWTSIKEIMAAIKAYADEAAP